MSTTSTQRNDTAQPTSVQNTTTVSRKARTRVVLIRGRILVKPRAGTATSSSACTGGGMVRVTITKGRKIVGRKFVSVSKTCAFRAPITLASTVTGKLSVEVKFLGNRVLKASRHTTKLQVNG